MNRPLSEVRGEISQRINSEQQSKTMADWSATVQKKHAAQVFNDRIK